MKKLLSFLIAASADAVISKITGTSCSLVREANEKTMNDWEAKEIRRKEMEALKNAQEAQTKKPINAALLGYKGEIKWGWNSNMDFVPLEIGDKRVTYGWNSNGDYVPLQIGDDRVSYGWNSNGDYVPKNVGGKDISYGWNSNMDFVAKNIGDENISYGWNSNGDFVAKIVGNNNVSYSWNANGDFVAKNIE